MGRTQKGEAREPVLAAARLLETIFRTVNKEAHGKDPRGLLPFRHSSINGSRFPMQAQFECS